MKTGYERIGPKFRFRDGTRILGTLIKQPTDFSKPVFDVTYSDGRNVNYYDNYEEAVAAVESQYEDAVIGHDGDLSDGGDRTLCWADESSSVGDDGSHAVASIQYSR